MIRIRPYDIGRYYVSTGGEEYLVDINEFNGNGHCGCRNFQYCHLPDLAKEQEYGIPHKQVRRCKHIIALHAAMNGSNSRSDAITTTKEG
jgi:hypothetical protein